MGSGNKGNVHRNSVHRFADLSPVEVTGVHALMQPDARVLPQLPVQLSSADVDRVHAFRSALQQAIHKAAR